MYIFPRRGLSDTHGLGSTSCPLLLITVLERTVHRVPHLPLHILPVTRKLVRAGAVEINRSRLIVNNRQIIRIQGRLPSRRFSIIDTRNAGPQLPA